jgi:hypothetical protein
MSLINDALKRAQEAQQKGAPPVGPGPVFQPAVQTQSFVPWGKVILASALGLALLLGGWLGFEMAQRIRLVHAKGTVPQSAGPAQSGAAGGRPSVSAPQTMASHAAIPAQRAAQPSPVAPRNVVGGAAPTNRLAADIREMAPASRQATAVPKATPSRVVASGKAPVQPASAAALAAPGSPRAGAQVAAAKPAVAASAALRLQKVNLHPQRPSAVISGRTVYLGERLGEFQVIAIRQNSAALVSRGQTNVLALLK